MKNIPIPGSISLPKPDHMPDDQHDPVQVVLVQNPHTPVTGFIMAFMPNKEDKEAIAAGKPIFLNILGPVLPFIHVLTFDEHEQPNS